MSPDTQRTLIYWCFAFYVAFTPALFVGGVMALLGIPYATVVFGVVFGFLFVEMISRRPKFNWRNPR